MTATWSSGGRWTGWTATSRARTSTPEHNSSGSTRTAICSRQTPTGGAGGNRWRRVAPTTSRFWSSRSSAGRGPNPLVITRGPIAALLGLPSAAPALNAVNLQVPPDATETTHIVGAPELTLTYSGTGTAKHVYAQIVDDETHLVLGNLATPIPVELDGGDTHTVTVSLEQVAHTLQPGQSVTVQIVTSTFNFLNFYSYGGHHGRRDVGEVADAGRRRGRSDRRCLARRNVQTALAVKPTRTFFAVGAVSTPGLHDAAHADVGEMAFGKFVVTVVMEHHQAPWLPRSHRSRGRRPTVPVSRSPPRDVAAPNRSTAKSISARRHQGKHH